MDLLNACLIAFVGWYADIVARAVVSFLGWVLRRVYGEKAASGSLDAEKIVLWTRGIRMYVCVVSGIVS